MSKRCAGEKWSRRVQDISKQLNKSATEQCVLRRVGSFFFLAPEKQAAAVHTALHSAQRRSRTSEVKTQMKLLNRRNTWREPEEDQQKDGTPSGGPTRVEGSAFSLTHETGRASATNAARVKDCRLVVGITVARRRGAKTEIQEKSSASVVLKGLIRVRLADSSGEVILVEKGTALNRSAASRRLLTGSTD